MSERRKEGRKEAGRGERGERAFASASWRSRVRRPRSRLCLRVPTAAVEADAAASTAAFSPPGVSSIHRVLRCLSHNLRVAGIFVTKPRLLLTLKQRRASRSKATKKERERRKEEASGGGAPGRTERGRTPFEKAEQGRRQALACRHPGN